MGVDELAIFLLASSRESVLLDNKWNNGILDLVRTAFVNAFMSLVKLTATPVSYLPRMFAFRPLAKPPYQELNAVRKSILGKLLSSDIISCSGFYVLLSSFDRHEYDRILDFLGVKLVDNECYANCIPSSNLVSRLSEEEDYLELLHFIVDNWLDFRTNDIKNLPLLKYENLNAGVSFFSMIACVQQRSSDRDSQGNFTHSNALDMIRLWGSRAYPFTISRETQLWKEQNWTLKLIIDEIDSLLSKWVEEDRKICIYGSTDLDWIRKLNFESEGN